MSIHDDFINKLISHPEWDVIRDELTACLDHEPSTVDLGNGLSVIYGEVDMTEEDYAKSNLYGELCWTINNGPGYCEAASEDIKVLLRRLGWNGN